MSEKKSESVVREIKRKTRRKYSTEEKITIVLEGLRGEESISTICRREGINPNLYYRWSRDFLEAGKKRLQGDTTREANSNEVSALRSENTQLKVLVAELGLRVPGDISIVGFDDFETATMLHSQLTVVRQPIQEISSDIVSVLLSRIEKPTQNPFMTKVLQTDIVYRNSTEGIAE